MVVYYRCDLAICKVCALWEGVCVCVCVSMDIFGALDICVIRKEHGCFVCGMQNACVHVWVCVVHGVCVCVCVCNVVDRHVRLRAECGGVLMHMHACGGV